MNAETFNSRYRIGTPVFAYPGCRPEDGADTRLVTRTRTIAQVSASGTDVVWVEGEGSYINLTHVDPVSESVWQAAKQAEETAAAVAAQGALPVPVGDQPQPLNDTRLAEIAARVEAATAGPWSAHEDWPGRVFSDGNPNYLHIARITGWNVEANEEFIAHAREDVPALLAEVQRLKAELAEMRAARDVIAQLYREADSRLDAVIAVCDREQRNAHRWENPLPVPGWVGAIRQALELAPTTTTPKEAS